MADAWVLLWSESQCAFHLEQVADMVKANRNAFVADRRMDYVPILVGTAQECHHLADALRPELHKRQDARDATRRAIERAKG